MNCPNCGTRNPDNAKYCINCGENLEQYRIYLNKETNDNSSRKVVFKNIRSVKNDKEYNIESDSEANIGEENIKPIKDDIIIERNSFNEHLNEDLDMDEDDEIIDRESHINKKKSTSRIIRNIFLLVLLVVIAFGAYKGIKVAASYKASIEQKQKEEAERKQRELEAEKERKQKELEAEKQRKLEEELAKKKALEKQQASEFIKNSSIVEVMLSNQESLFNKNLKKIKTLKGNGLFKDLNLGNFFNQLFKVTEKDENFVAMKDNTSQVEEAYEKVSQQPDLVKTQNQALQALVKEQRRINDSFLSTDKKDDYEAIVASIETYSKNIKNYKKIISDLKNKYEIKE